MQKNLLINMLSANQINAQIKLFEVWKSNNWDNYPIQLPKQSIDNDKTNTINANNGTLIKSGKATNALKSFVNDATKLWNWAPVEIKKIVNISVRLKQQSKNVCI